MSKSKKITPETCTKQHEFINHGGCKVMVGTMKCWECGGDVVYRTDVKERVAARMAELKAKMPKRDDGDVGV